MLKVAKLHLQRTGRKDEVQQHTRLSPCLEGGLENIFSALRLRADSPSSPYIHDWPRAFFACLLIDLLPLLPPPLSCAERRRKSPLSPSFFLPPPPQPFFLFPNHRTVCRCSSSPFSSFLCPVARGKNEWPPSVPPSQFSSSLTLFSHERSSSSSLPSSPPHPPKTLPFSQKQLFLSSPSSSFSAMK